MEKYSQFTEFLIYYYSNQVSLYIFTETVKFLLFSQMFSSLSLSSTLNSIPFSSSTSSYLGLFNPTIINCIRQEKIYQHFCSIWQHIAHSAHSAHYNVQRIVLTQVRHTAAFNNVVQLIAHLQLLRQVVPFILNALLTYNTIFAHSIYLAYFKQQISVALPAHLIVFAQSTQLVQNKLYYFR